METRALSDDGERSAAVGILQQLWSDAGRAEILAWTEDDDYHLLGRFDGEELVGVAGVSVTRVLHHARTAWITDLVVDEPRRGEGHGTALLGFVEEWADERDCEYIALASPLAKTDVHDYYEGQGYDQWGYVIETEL